MTKLTKAQEKRFNLWFKVWGWKGKTGYDETLTPNKIKQFLADELARQKKEIIEELPKLTRLKQSIQAGYTAIGTHLRGEKGMYDGWQLDMARGQLENAIHEAKALDQAIETIKK